MYARKPLYPADIGATGKTMTAHALRITSAVATLPRLVELDGYDVGTVAALTGYSVATVGIYATRGILRRNIDFYVATYRRGRWVKRVRLYTRDGIRTLIQRKLGGHVPAHILAAATSGSGLPPPPAK